MAAEDFRPQILLWRREALPAVVAARLASNGRQAAPKLGRGSTPGRSKTPKKGGKKSS